MDVKFWIQEHFHPVVAVSASPAAEAICVNKNGLTVVDMLRPYSVLQQLNVPVRVGETSSRVMELKLRFHNAAHMFSPKTEVVDEHLRHVLLVAASRFAKHEPLDNLLTNIQAGTGQDFTPWYAEYREEFLRMLCFSEHDTLDHPLACVYVIPADVPDPLSHFRHLMDKGPVPPLMEREVMCPFKDPQFPKHYVLLHDGYVGGDEAWAKAQENLAIIDRTYGANHCALVRINTAKADAKTVGAPADLFKRFRRAVITGGGAGEPEQLPPDPPCGLGGRLSVTDLDGIAQMVKDFSTKTLLPKLEDRINRLNTNITASKRGFRNRVARLLVGKMSNEAAANDTPYPHHSAESQMRQLADLAFLLKHYDFAASMYRLGAQDYWQQHNFGWYAGAEEMIGLCSVMEATEASDPMKYFTRAWENYSKCPGRQNRMLATRAMIFCATYHTSMGRHLATNHILMRAHFEEENARAALLLEQAGYSLLYLKQPFIRRFAFHMVLAGLRYHACDQKKLAIHAYRQVLSVYHNRNWRFIEEHLNDILGKQCREFGEHDGALTHFMALLGCTHRPGPTQQHYIQQFLDAVKKIEVKQEDSSKPVIEALNLPLLNTRDIEVQHADHRCYGNNSAYRVEESAWARMEQSLVAAANPELNNWVVKQVVNHEEYNTSVIGEEIGIKVELTNPLQVKLKVSQLKLLVQFSEATAPEPPAEGKTASLELDKQVHLSEDGCTMQPGETSTITLRACPRVGGWLRVLGVHWVLNDAVEGRALFNVRGRKRKKPKGSRPSQQKHYPPNRRLLFFIIPTMPRLDVAYDSLPKALYQGELCEVNVRLTNKGNAPLRNLHFMTDQAGLAINHCSCKKVTPGRESAARHTSPGMQLAGTEVSLSKDQPDLRGYIYKFDQDGMELAEGESATVSLWLHPRVAGENNFLCVWYCEPQDEAASMKYRSLRLSHPITVPPLLRIRPAVSPSAKDLFRFLLRLDLETSKDGETVWVQHVGAFTQGEESVWRMSGMNQSESGLHPAVHSMEVDKKMVQGETATLFYMLHPPASLRSASAPASPTKLASNPQTQSLSAHTDSNSLFSPEAQHFHQAFGSLSSSSKHGPHMSDPPLDIMLSWTINPSASATTPRDPPATPAASDNTPPGPVSPSSKSSQPSSQSRYSLSPRFRASNPSTPGGALGPSRDTSFKSSPSSSLSPQRPPSLPTPASQHPRYGVLHLYDVVSAHSMNPVRMLMDSQPTIRHDFRKQTMCVAPVTLTLRNSFTAPCKAMIVTGPEKSDTMDSKHSWITLPPPSGLSPSTTSSTDPFPRTSDGSLTSISHQHGMSVGLAPAPEYLWCGATTINVGELQAGETSQVYLQVAVFRPGAYLVGDYQCRYSISTGDGKVVSKTQPGSPFLLQVQAVGGGSPTKPGGAQPV